MKSLTILISLLAGSIYGQISDDSTKEFKIIPGVFKSKLPEKTFEKLWDTIPNNEHLINSVKVPEVVLKKFKSLFPTIDSVKWEKVDWTLFAHINSYSVTLNYGADFKLNQLPVWARFDSTAKNHFYKINLPLDSFPPSVHAYLKKHYKRHISSEKYLSLESKRRKYYKYVTYWECIEVENGIKHYLLTMYHDTIIKRQQNEYYFIFDANGTFVEKGISHSF